MNHVGNIYPILIIFFQYHVYIELDKPFEMWPEKMVICCDREYVTSKILWIRIYIMSTPRTEIYFLLPVIFQ